jgi:DNA-binding NarL/FixJ family response regulator
MSAVSHCDNKIPSVFIADASPLDCQLLAASLLRNRMRVAGWATRSSDIVSAMSGRNPEVALIGVRLEDGQRTGLNALRELREFLTQTRVVMLLDSDEPTVIVEAFRHGAKGVFSRQQVSSGLAKCIRCVLAGQLWANNEQMHCLVEDLRANSSAATTTAVRIDQLTKRELEVGMLVAEGLTNRGIGEQLGLSEHTIKNYLLAVFEKLQVSTRVELALLFPAGHREGLSSKSETGSVNHPAISV